MKYLKQLLMILGISLLGELCRYILPLPVPASIYGLVLLLAALLLGILKLEQVKETGTFLVEIMPVMFIPAGVGLLVSWKVLKPIVIPTIFITIATTVIVMLVAGHVTQYMIRRKGRRKDG